MTNSLTLSQLRRSTAELMAYAVCDLYPGVQLLGAGVTEFAFHYDFIAEQPLDDHALPLIEEKMRGLIKEGIEVRCIEMMRENAAAFLLHHQQPFAAARAESSRDNIVSLFQIGSFNDLCPAPFIKNTSELGAFKLLKVEKFEELLHDNFETLVTRVYGVAAFDQQELKALVKALNHARKKHHAPLGEKFHLFEENDLIAPGSYLFTGQGVALREALVDQLSQAYEAEGFTLLSAPPLVNEDLYAKFGMFYDEEEYDVSLPLSLTPIHAAFFASKLRSINNLPMRLFQWGYINNRQRDPFLAGLHLSSTLYAEQGSILCTTEQVVGEVISSLQFIEKIVKIYKFEGYWTINDQARKQAASSVRWKKGLESLRQAFDACGIPFQEQFTEELVDGPLAEMRLRDSLGREWRGPSIAFDFGGVDHLEMRYKGVDGEMVKPVLLVRKVFGSIERFLAILLEHDPGAITTLTTAAKKKAYLTEKEVNA